MKRSADGPERVGTLVIGGGQAGLSVGYHLARQGLPFLIVDANPRIGDPWRKRWDSLRLFTPAKMNCLPGMRFPAPPNTFPTKDAMAAYLESYAERFNLPVATGVRVERLFRAGGRFIADAGDRRFEADNVVVAMSTHQQAMVPEFARELDPDIVQIHSVDYRNPGQLREGDVLIVGAGNSGAEIGLELSRTHRVWLSGRPTGHLPFDLHGLPARLILIRLVLRGLFHRVLTVDTPIGRKVRPKILAQGGPLIRTRPGVLEKAGVTRVPRTVGARDGRPLLQDGRTLDVKNVVWCSGFHAGFTWIDVPVGGDVEPRHERGIVPDQPGLYFVGLEFLYSFSSIMVHGVGRDAERVVRHIAARASDVDVRPPAATTRADRAAARAAAPRAGRAVAP